MIYASNYNKVFYILGGIFVAFAFVTLFRNAVDMRVEFFVFFLLLGILVGSMVVEKGIDVEKEEIHYFTGSRFFSKKHRIKFKDVSHLLISHEIKDEKFHGLVSNSLKLIFMDPKIAAFPLSASLNQEEIEAEAKGLSDRFGWPIQENEALQRIKMAKEKQKQDKEGQPLS